MFLGMRVLACLCLAECDFVWGGARVGLFVSMYLSMIIRLFVSQYM